MNRLTLNREEVVSSLILVVIWMSDVSAAPWKNGNEGLEARQHTDNEGLEQERAWVGLILSKALLRDCGAFVGRLVEVVEPEHQAKTVDRRRLSYAKVTISVEEWLYGERQHYADVLQLEQVPVVSGLMYGSEYRGAVWRDVQVKVGKKLLVFFHPKASQAAEMQTTIDRYDLVVSKETLFPAIRDTLSRHTQLTQDPDQVLGATNWLNTDQYKVLSGYLVYHLWATAGHDHLDSAAIVLSQLMGDERIQQSGWWLLEMPLVRVMSDGETRLSDAARTQAMQNLVKAGCSQNTALAKSALRVMTLLSEVGHLDLEPFLTEGCRQKLENNYRQLVQSEFEKKRRAKFEAQLGLNGNSRPPRR